MSVLLQLFVHCTVEEEFHCKYDQNAAFWAFTHSSLYGFGWNEWRCITYTATRTEISLIEINIRGIQSSITSSLCYITSNSFALSLSLSFSLALSAFSLKFPSLLLYPLFFLLLSNFSLSLVFILNKFYKIEWKEKKIRSVHIFFSLAHSSHNAVEFTNTNTTTEKGRKKYAVWE